MRKTLPASNDLLHTTYLQEVTKIERERGEEKEKTEKNRVRREKETRKR